MQKPHSKIPFCLAAPVDREPFSAAAASASHSEMGSLVREADWRALLLALPWLLRPRNLAVRAETLEMMLPRADEVSERARMLLPESKRLGASSDFTDE